MSNLSQRRTCLPRVVRVWTSGVQVALYLSKVIKEPRSFSPTVMSSIVVPQRALGPQTCLLQRLIPSQPSLITIRVQVQKTRILQTCRTQHVGLLMKLNCRLQTEIPSFSKVVFPSISVDWYLYSGFVPSFRTWVKMARSQQMPLLWRISLHVFQHYLWCCLLCILYPAGDQCNQMSYRYILKTSSSLVFGKLIS